MANQTETPKLYLKPSGLTFCQDVPLSLPLCGGPLYFNALTVTLRSGQKIVYQGAFPVTSLEALKNQLPKAIYTKFDQTLKRLTAPRNLMGFTFDRPLVMGILNLTPDSFSDGGDYQTGAADRARALFDEGADIVDVGAESTRPGAAEVSEEEELKRLGPVLDIIKDLPGPVSVDTRKASVMTAALKAGVGLINDVSALTFEPSSMAAAKPAGGIVLMHALGTPKTMQDDPEYNDVLLDVYDYLEDRIEACVKAGIPRDHLIIDPGIGFGKTTSHNLDLIRGLALFHGLGVPVLFGASRKRFIGELTGANDPKDRLAGSIAAALLAAGQGAQIIRVHDVHETRQALSIQL